MPGIDARAPERTDTSSGLARIAEALADDLLDAREVALRPRRAAPAG